MPTIFHALFGLYCDLQSLDLHLGAALDQIGPGNRNGDLVNEAIHNLQWHTAGIQGFIQSLKG